MIRILLNLIDKHDWFKDTHYVLSCISLDCELVTFIIDVLITLGNR